MTLIIPQPFNLNFLFFLIFSTFSFFSPLFGKELVIFDFSPYLFTKKNFLIDKKLVAHQDEHDVIQPVFYQNFDQASEFANQEVIWKKGFIDQAPYFYSYDSKLILPPEKLNQFFHSDSLNSFNLSFYFKMKQPLKNSTLIERKQLFEINKTVKSAELKVSLNNDFLQVDLKNFFEFNGHLLSLSLSTEQPISKEKWIFFSINYNHLTGLLELRLDGELMDFTYSTSSGQGYGTIYLPGFKYNGDQFILGKNFLGSIDELRFYDQSVSVEELVFNKKNYISTYVSKTFRIEPRIRLNRIRFLGRNVDENNLEFYLCKNKRYFNPLKKYNSCLNLSWDKEFYFDDYDSYFQFFIVLKSNQRGESVVDNITFDYNLLTPLHPPFFLDAWVSQDKVILNWKRDFNPNIDAYNIYFAKNEFKHNVKKITVSLKELKRIASHNDEHAFVISDLEENEKYFFAISSLDTKNNRESDFSNVKNIYFNKKIF